MWGSCDAGLLLVFCPSSLKVRLWVRCGAVNNSQNIEKNIENESSTEYNKNRGIAHPSLKHYADAINNGDVFSVDFIGNLPEIAEANKRANFDKSTFELYPVGINPERDTLRKEIKDYLLSDKNGAAVFEKGKLKKQNSEGVYTGEVKQERIADIVIGPPAAGKSTVFADKLSNEHSARIIDSDIAKSMLPEFDNGYGASMVQDESAYIVEVLALDEAIKRGDNIVLPKVGKSYNSLFEFISVLKDEGYTVNLYYNELPTEKAINRAFARFITTGRYLPIKYLKAVKAADIENTYKKMKESGLIDYYEWKSNDVRFGDEPTLKESGYGRTAENRKKSGRQNAPVGSDGLYSVPQRENSSPQSNTKSAEIKGTSSGVSISLPENEKAEKKAKLVPEKFAREQAKKAEDGLPESVGAMKASEKNITHMVNEYGEMKPGEKPERFISMPISTDGNDRVGKFARTAAEAGVTSEKMVQAIEKAVARGDFSHEIWRDSKAIDDAVAYIEKYGYGATLDEFYKRVDNKGQVTKGDMTKAMTMYAVAVENNNIETALKLAVKINKAAVNAGQVVQSVRILKKSSPEGRLYFAQKSLEAYQDEVNEKYGSNAPELVVDDSILKALKDARTEEEIQKATADMHQAIADQLPFSWSNFITSWRYLAMLGNPRTQVRNVISNAVNSVASEYVNWIQAGIEKSTRMSTSTTTDKPTQKQIDYAKLDYQIVKEQLSGEGKYRDNSLNSIERMKNPFSFPTFWGKEGDQFVGWKGNVRKYGEPLMKGLTKWNEATNYAMEKWDLIFSEKAYVKAFARYLKANNINPAKITGEEKMDARAWATRQALESVFRENNQLANRISRLERNLVNSNSKGGKVGAVVIGGLMPFKSTPLNITKRAFEYTPLGIIKGIADIKTNEKVYMPAAINDIAKGLSGTSLIILGAALAKYGLLKGGLGDDKEDKMAKQMGQQAYSIDTPWFSYTLDWGGAALMPLFVGADIYESNSEDDSWLMNIVNALANAGSPIIETSMMTGMMDAIQSMSYEDVATEKLVAGLSSAMANYLGQFVPTLFGQVARAVDDTSRSSYTDVKGALKPLAKTAQKAQNKIPFLSKTNVPYMDVWGNDEKNFGGNVVGRLAYNMLSPGYVSTKSNDKVEKMLADLYDKTGETSVLPSNYTTYKRMGDETIRFTDKQYEAYTKAYGQTAYDILEDLSTDKGFKSMEDAYKAEVIAKVYKYSTAIASNDVVDKELTARQANQQKAMAKGLPAYEVFGGLIEADGMGSEGNANGTLSKSEVMAYIESRGGLSKTEKAYLFAALGNSNWINPYI